LGILVGSSPVEAQRRQNNLHLYFYMRKDILHGHHPLCMIFDHKRFFLQLVSSSNRHVPSQQYQLFLPNTILDFQGDLNDNIPATLSLL